MLDNPLIARLALDWLRAEHLARVAKGEAADTFVADPDELSVASDRVYQICSGEVRWSDCGPGDKAVWRGRLRDVEKFEQLWRSDPTPQRNLQELTADAERRRNNPNLLPNYPGPGDRNQPFNVGGDFAADRPRTGPQLHGYRQRNWHNWFDTVTVDRQVNTYYRLFGNENVGNPWKTSLQVAGQLGSDSTGVILSWYASITTMNALRWAADNVQAQMVIGDRPQGAPTFFRDLFVGIALLRPWIIPIRQNVSMQITCRKIEEVATLEPFEMTFHLDGLLTTDAQ